MKVLHFTHRFWPAKGGVEAVVENLCIELQKKGIQSDVLTLDTLDERKLKKFEKKGKIKIFRLPLLDLKYYKITPLPFEIIKDYDIIHIHSMGFFSDAMLLFKPLHGKKIVFSTHGGIFHTKSIQSIKEFYFNSIEKQLLKRADGIIAVSKADKEKFSKIVPKNKLTLIENGFSAKEAGGKKEKNLFICVGRLSKNKNIERVVDVFSKLNTEYKLIIAGKDFDGLKKELTKKVSKLGLSDRIKIIGEVSEEELHKIYSKAEYFVSASKYEGFGITAIEAMHYNCVTILNDIPTFRDFASHKRGYIIDFESEKATNQIEEIKKKNNTEVINKAKKYSTEFLWKNKISEFIALYKKI